MIMVLIYIINAKHIECNTLCDINHSSCIASLSVDVIFCKKLHNTCMQNCIINPKSGMNIF